MKILSVEQIREADKFTIENEPIASIDLMERASSKVVEWLIKNFSKENQFYVLAGSGNNGGDGLAIARLLAEKQKQVTVVLVLGTSGSEDFEENLKRLKPVQGVNIYEEFDTSKITSKTIIIDAIFGSGLSRPIEGNIAKVINEANDLEATRIAVDMPSGIFADKKSPDGAIFKADYTLSFQVPKLAFMIPENQKYVGHFDVLDIGLSSEFISNCISDYSIFDITKKETNQLKTDSIAHKGTRGRATIIAGGHAKMGAAILAAKGALHSGIGLLTVQTCMHCIDIVQNSIPEALVLKDENEYILGCCHDYENQDVVVFGPAVGFANRTRKLLENLLTTYKGQLILDADAITILSEHRELLEILPAGTILTPHPGEFKRLVGDFSDEFERLMQLKSFCMHHKVVMVLKGKYSSVCNEEGKVSFNPTGNQGMAKGGSGDLLCGILAGLAPTLGNPFETAKLAVFLHGLAGDISLKEYGEFYMTPSTMIEKLSDAFKTIES